MVNQTTLSNGLVLLTIPMPHLDSVTTLLAVGAGSRYENKKNKGISHFLEHMFFKGSKKFPSTEVISNLVDGIGAINNASTAREYTYYWIKSSAKHIDLAVDILSSMVKEPLLDHLEIDREKGVILEEMKMIKDDPVNYLWYLYDKLHFGDQPLGWEITGDEKSLDILKQQDFINYINGLYAIENMVLVFAGKLPKNILNLAEKYFFDLPKRKHFDFEGVKLIKQTKPNVNISFRQTDQANLILGTEGFGRFDKRRYAATVLAVILGEGMSSRLFRQVRERRGLAYHVSADHDYYMDTGVFEIFAGLKLDKVYQGLEVILNELKKLTQEKIGADELKKAKEIIRGRLAIRGESTNFLATSFGVQYVLEGKIETFKQYLEKIDAVIERDVQKIAQLLFIKDKFNLQLIGPFKSTEKFEKILKG